MANRHSHKKLRAEARARMALTGETYQQARQQSLALQASSCAPAGPVQGFAVLEFSHFGEPAVLATWHSYGVPVAIVISEALQRPLVHPRFTTQSGSGWCLEGSR
jgi:hypothetical protein